MSPISIDKYATPYKLGRPVLAGSGVAGRFDSHSVDVPFVFYHQDRYYMMYLGFDGQGYQTALAVSDNLEEWQHVAILFERGGTTGWDRVGAGGTWILKETNDLYAKPVLKKVDGKYWMVYHSYPDYGYEEGAAEVGLAWCEDEDLLTWHRLEQPVFSWKDGGDWEKGGLYKVCLIEHDSRYYMFYNAKNLTYSNWIEQTGIAVSDDLLHWQRVEHNPVLEVTPNAWDSKFVSDPAIYRDGELWLNFFFGFDGIHAQEGLAVSDDLLHWSKLPQPIIAKGESGELDATHAHKASMVYHNGILYHFYCACRPYQGGDLTGKEKNDFRTITFATSQPIK